MTLETEKYDPVNTHWVRLVEGRTGTLDERKQVERELENAFTHINRRALREEMVVLALSCTPCTPSEYYIIYTLIANIVPRQVLEQQQMRQRLSQN